MVCVNGINYEVIEDFRDGWNEEEFTSRYSEILHKYDYIVGDWGYNQLRLRGFFDDQNDKANYETKFSTVPEYLLEFCNFGCPYFILKKIKTNEPKKESKKPSNKREMSKAEKGN